MTTDEARIKIGQQCEAIKNLLIEKNKKYGNSALEPCRVFSDATPIGQLLVRIDDKLSRIKHMGVGIQIDEDTVTDLIGYLILLKIAISTD